MAEEQPGTEKPAAEAAEAERNSEQSSGFEVVGGSFVAPRGPSTFTPPALPPSGEYTTRRVL